MAPGASVAFSILFAAQYAGGATPLAVLVGLGLCLLIAITIGQMAKHLPSAGGLYTYNARGLGRNVGFLVGWAFIMAEVVVAPGGLLILGIVVSAALHTHLGWPTWTWAPFSALGGVIVWALVYRGIRLSTAAGVVLGAFEIVVFVALAVALIGDAVPTTRSRCSTRASTTNTAWGRWCPGCCMPCLGSSASRRPPRWARRLRARESPARGHGLVPNLSPASRRKASAIRGQAIAAGRSFPSGARDRGRVGCTRGVLLEEWP